MKPIKKFSSEVNQPKSILESIDSKALTELINGMGFKDIHELKKEKALLSKLEALLKEVSPKEDVSEDDAEEIEADIKKKGETKKLPTEVSEDDSEEIEDKLKKKGEPKSIEDKTPSKIADVPTDGIDSEDEEEEESEEEEEAEAEEAEEVEEESKKTPKATRKVMTFEDFIQEETTTVNKNISYRDDEDDEDEAVPVADSKKTNIKNDKTTIKETGSSDGRVIKSFGQFVAEAVVDAGPELKDEEATADNIVLPIAKGNGSETAAGIAGDIMDMGKPEEKKDKEGEELVTNDQEITKKPETSKDEVEIHSTVVVEESSADEYHNDEIVDILSSGKFVYAGDTDEYDYDINSSGNIVAVNNEIAKDISAFLKKNGVKSKVKNNLVIAESVIIESVNEAEIKSDEEFKEYAFAILQKAFGDDFDEAKAQEVVDGLISKYSGDYGAMVGALQSTMGS
jgi:hypothetical protein